MTEPMRICYVTPGVGPCGGIRIIVEHANRLAARGHVVALAAPSVSKPSWIDLEAPIAPFSFFFDVNPFDAVVATGYQTVDIALRIPAKQRYYFVQMMEHEFFKEGTNGHHAAQASYLMAKTSGFRFITIAGWLHGTMKQVWDIDSVIIPNGVNRDDFYPDGDKRHMVLVEGDARNRAKDINGIAWRVAYQLREEFGVEIWGFSALPAFQPSLFDVYREKPTTRQMREMYSQALFLLKASRFEGRACAPVEAMACGTTSVVAVIKGSDDLVDGKNCFRTEYDFDKLLFWSSVLLSEEATRRRLGRNALRYANRHLNWDPIIDQLEEIYSGRSTH